MGPPVSPPPAGAPQAQQNSFPSGSAITTLVASSGWPISTFRRSCRSTRSTGAPWSFGHRSKCSRFLIVCRRARRQDVAGHIHGGTSLQRLSPALVLALEVMMQPNACDQKRANSSQSWASITTQSTTTHRSRIPRLEADSGSRAQMTPPAVRSRGRLCRADERGPLSSGRACDSWFRDGSTTSM